MAKGDRQWHVPLECWDNGAPGGIHILNIGNDIATTLISTDSADVGLDVPDNADEYIVERVIGQWNLHGNEASPQSYYVHNRVYPTVSDQSTIILRDLTSPDDAESDFLWHQVSGWDPNFDTDPFGDWTTGLQASPAPTPFMGRHGHVDIRVNRRIKQGFSLIWHTQLSGPANAVDNEFNLHLWLRMLLREA